MAKNTGLGSGVGGPRPVRFHLHPNGPSLPPELITYLIVVCLLFGAFLWVVVT